MPGPLNKYSRHITQPKSQGASQAMLYGTGLTEADMQKPQVGIASVWYEGNTCNMHLNTLAERVKEGVVAAGMVGMRFNTIGVSDGISMGTDGMSYSLQSRDLIADSIETVMGAQWYDANISLPGCDKNMPGCLIAMGRLNRPAIMVYGGTIKPGHRQRRKARHRLGLSVLRRIPRRQDRRDARGRRSCGTVVPAPAPAAACTRPTPWPRPSKPWACRCPTARSIPAEDPAKLDECLRAGAAIRLLLERDIKPRDIMTRAGVRERDGRGHGPGRIDQRRAAPDRHGPGGRRAAVDRRLPDASAIASRSWPISSRAANTCRKICTTSAARRP